MKNILKGTAIILGLLMAGVWQANAQEFKTDESISSQLKNGTAPGLKFGPTNRSARVAKTANDPNKGTESQVAQIRKGTLKGVRFAGGGSTGQSIQRTARPAARLQGGASLPSDEKASVKQPVLPVQPGVVPTQNGSAEVKEGKTALPAKPILQSKKQD